MYRNGRTRQSNDKMSKNAFKDPAWEQRIKNEKKAANEFESKWGFINEMNSNSNSNKLKDIGPDSHYPTKKRMKEGNDYDMSRMCSLQKAKAKNLTNSTHNFKNFIENKPINELPGQPLYTNSNRLRYQYNIKPGIPQETYDYPVCSSMEYGWNWTGKNIDRIFGSLNVNPVQMAMDRWKMEKKN